MLQHGSKASNASDLGDSFCLLFGEMWMSTTFTEFLVASPSELAATTINSNAPSHLKNHIVYNKLFFYYLLLHTTLLYSLCIFLLHFLRYASVTS